MTTAETLAAQKFCRASKCAYWAEIPTPMCNYFTIEGKLRLCKPGEGCNKFITRGDYRKMAEPRKFIDYNRVRELYNQGMTDKEIAAELGCNNSRICAWRKENGLAPNIRKAPEQSPAAEVHKLEPAKAKEELKEVNRSADISPPARRNADSPKAEAAAEPQYLSVSNLRDILSEFMDADITVDGKHITEVVYGCIIGSNNKRIQRVDLRVGTV